MSGFFSKRNTQELERMFRYISREGSTIEFEARFGTYVARRFVNGISETGVKILMESQEIYSSGPESSMTLSMIATNAYGAPRKLVHMNPTNGDILKTEYQHKENLNNIYSINNNLKISLSRETVLTGNQVVNVKYDLFRMRNRKSYISKNGLWRYDFTKVYQLDNVKNSVTLKDWLHNILQNKEEVTRHEFELEFIVPKKQITGDLIKQSFLDELITINKIIKFSDRIFVDKNKLTVFSELKTLLPGRLRNKDISAISVKGGIAKSTGTVSYSNLALLLNGKYAVTEKIDGVRMLIFITNYQVYAINLKNEVINLGITQEQYQKLEAVNKKTLENTLLDCEYVITRDKKCMFAIFDILVDSGVNITLTKDLHDRHSRLRDLQKVWDKLSAMEIHLEQRKVCTWFNKKFYYPKTQNDFYVAVKKVNDTKYPYELDGIIFTPMEDSYYSGLSLKWKPMQLNTIDFLTRIVKVDRKKKAITLNLYVGVSIRDFIAKRMKRQDDYFKLFPQYTENSIYFPILFNPPNPDTDPMYTTTLVYTDAKCDAGGKICRYMVNDIPIEDNTVLEMAYRHKKWVPIKYRDDKTGVYQTQGRDAGNYWNIAYNVWDNIVNPVTIDILTGKSKIQDKYFRKTPASSHTMSMVRFHNFIKLCYYRKYTKNHNDWVMELAAGRGNDINKHIRIGTKNVLLVDIDQTAIDEGKMRINALGPREKTTHFETMVADIGSSDMEKKLTAAGYSFGQFDAVVCNFGIHYVFGSKDSMKIVKDYVTKFLKKGGIFMFSTFDGKKVFDFLINNKVGYNEEYKFFNHDNLLFVIKRLFKSDQFSNYGQEVGIYIDRIGSYMNEYLVNLEYVTELFTKDNSFKLLENTSFEKWYPIYLRKTKNKHASRNVKMNDSECTFSFFYNYVVFQKR